MCGILGLCLSRGQTEPGLARFFIGHIGVVGRICPIWCHLSMPLPELESDLIAAFERQDLTRIGRGRDFKPETLD